jgi:hypothetical protein
MLATTLNTNEIKNAAGTEVEFQRISTGPGRAVEYAQITETYNAPHRLRVSHSESGSGADKRRRSVVRFDKTITGADGVARVITFYKVADIPVGDMTTTTEAANVSAELNSFCASLGVSTTILYDGTGNGDTCLLTGGL